MKSKNIYYSVEPIMKVVNEETLINFLKNYPRKLNRDVTGICDPPALSYNDFKLADRWPSSIVAIGYLWSDDPKDYFYKPKEERRYFIMENYEEVFNSRIRYKTED